MTYPNCAERPLENNSVGQVIPLNDEFSRLHALNKRIQRVQWWAFAALLIFFPAGIVLGLYTAFLVHKKQKLEADVEEKFKKFCEEVLGIGSIVDTVKSPTQTEDAIIKQIGKDITRFLYISIDGKQIETIEELESYDNISLNILDCVHQGGAASACVPLTFALLEVNPELLVTGECRSVNGLRKAVQYSFIDLNKQQVEVVSVYKASIEESVLSVRFKGTTVFNLNKMEKTTRFEPYFGE